MSAATAGLRLSVSLPSHAYLAAIREGAVWFAFDDCWVNITRDGVRWNSAPPPRTAVVRDTVGRSLEKTPPSSDVTACKKMILHRPYQLAGLPSSVVEACANRLLLAVCRSLIGLGVDDQMVVHVQGGTACGKSALMGLLECCFPHLVGTGDVPALLGMGDASQAHRAEYLFYRPAARITYAEEVSDDICPITAKAFKETTGSRHILAKSFGRRATTMLRTDQLWLLTNHPLRFTRDDDAIRRRVLSIRFPSDSGLFLRAGDELTNLDGLPLAAAEWPDYLRSDRVVKAFTRLVLNACPAAFATRPPTNDPFPLVDEETPSTLLLDDVPFDWSTAERRLQQSGFSRFQSLVTGLQTHLRVFVHSPNASSVRLPADDFYKCLSALPAMRFREHLCAYDTQLTRNNCADVLRVMFGVHKTRLVGEESVSRGRGRMGWAGLCINPATASRMSFSRV